ncbi:MAG: zinc-dependent metalloprotease [Betaproteobacteria bacterium]|nr:zinc-dependent metalloprotease [Betaproteobacteria bacterium]
MSMGLALSGTLLLGCAQLAAAPVVAQGEGAAAPAAVASAAAAARPQPAPGAPKPFADVIKDAKEHKGLFTLYENDKEGKVWLEIAPDQFGPLYFLQVNINQGLSSSYLAARRMLKGEAVSFRRVGQSVQLVARNLTNHATPGTPEALAVAENTADSLVGSAPIVSAPHPERKSVLIELNGLLLADIPGLTTQFDAAYRTGYALDARNSFFERVRATPELVALSSKLLFSVPKLPAPPVTPPPTPAALPAPVKDTPDARSFFVGLYTTLTQLPDVPMHARAADGRIGHFNVRQWDFSDEQDDNPRRYVIDRWRLEKKDPSAALSEPRQPIVFWLDKNIPLQYRDTVRAGVLEWNKAFERIGFKDAIVVKQQTDSDSFDTDDTRHASIRWVVDHSEGALGVGPSVVDPRSGEILDADIGITHGWTRLPRYLTRYQFPRPMGTGAAADGARWITQGGEPASADYCNYGDDAIAEAGFALDLLALRGEIAPDGPEADAIVKATLKDVITHEVGHTLGLRHNFRASTIYPLAKLDDPSFTHANGLGGSVMDYNGWNIALDNEKQGEYVMSTLGPYDYWAIEYAYKEIPPAQEKAALAAIAARSTQPELAYATDEEISGDGDGMDPTVNQRDLGSDPLAYAERRVQLSRELLARLEKRGVKPGESYGVLAQSFRSAARQVEASLAFAAKYVGGVKYVRDYGGTGRLPYTPVPAAEQRRALKMLTDTLFTGDGFALPPDLVAKLAPDALERGYTPPDDVQPGEVWLGLQRAALDRLMSDKVANRITQAPSKLAAGNSAISLAEVYERVQSAVWAELKTGRDISAPRRALQREHLRRLTASLVRPSAQGNADARALNRMGARELLAQIRSSEKRAGLSREARAHLAESAALLEEALKAPLVRAS